MKKILQKIKGYKTIIFGSGLIALPFLLDLFSYLDAAPLEAFMPVWVTIPIGAIVIILRALTKGPVGSK